jgi:hypothetical protein
MKKAILIKMEKEGEGNLGSTAASFVFAFYPHLDNISRSPDTGIHRKRVDRAVIHTGPAFHAGVDVFDSGLFVFHFKHLLGANLGAKTASYAKMFIEFQGGDSFQISHAFHGMLPFVF